MNFPLCRVWREAARPLALAAAFAGVSFSAAPAAPTSSVQALPGHVPSAAYLGRAVGRVGAAERVDLALTLPLRDQAALDALLLRLYDPSDASYGKFLTPDEFASRFSPTPADYQAVAAFATSHGLTITGTHSNRTALDVAGPASVIEAALGLHLLQYQAPDGRIVRAPDAEPKVPAILAEKIAGVVGLDTIAVRHSDAHEVSSQALPAAAPYQIGTGPNNGLTPADIKTAYNLNSVLATGAGQTLGLFELDGYKASDIAAYESYFGLPGVPLQNVLVDGASGRAGSGASEVTLDIELQAALAPGANKIVVYEGPNTNVGVVDTYNRIATDNLAKAISTSWGAAEASSSSTVLQAENTAFQQMAAQGQTIYAAAGDKGAYDNGSSLSVDDPASQPYMCGVGGTQLYVNSGETYNHETTWNLGSASAGAGGGGISTIWPIPSYQSGVITPASQGSTTQRNVPDVALNSDQYTGYAIYYKRRWTIYGGTSCAAPLWAAFTALVNQGRAGGSKAALGFANLPIYSIAKGPGYPADFHDIADGSTNLFYPAVPGYDDATGWGSFNGANLYGALVGY